MKKCKSCKVPFEPRNSSQLVCSYSCAISYANKLNEKKAKQDFKLAKDKIKTRSEWIKEVQQVFNQFIRYRDKDDGCISCDKPATWQGQWHASHYYATSVRPNLRFNENNVHKACSVCNNYKHGNLIPYREKLIKKIGIDAVNILDSDKEPAKYSIQDLMEKKKHYAEQLKKLKNKVQD